MGILSPTASSLSLPFGDPYLSPKTWGGHEKKEAAIGVGVYSCKPFSGTLFRIMFLLNSLKNTTKKGPLRKERPMLTLQATVGTLQDWMPAECGASC